MPYADFNWYKEIYQGFDIEEDEFFGLALKATKYLEKITFGRIDEADESVMLAMCAVADEIKKSAPGLYASSEANDGYSISYRDNNAGKIYEAAELYLPPELLYRGVEV